MSLCPGNGHNERAPRRPSPSLHAVHASECVAPSKELLTRLQYLYFSRTPNASHESLKKKRSSNPDPARKGDPVPEDSFALEYDIVSVLGEGATCKVLKGRNKKSGQMVAVKVIPKKHIEDREEFPLIAKEIPILKQLSHPNIVRYLDVFFSRESLTIVLELVTGHELFEELMERRTFSEPEAVTITSKILCALAYLHERGIVHADLKPENIMLTTKEVTKDAEVKLIDFGLAHKESTEAHQKSPRKPRGTLGYRAPELLADEEGTPATDMWALGVILYTMLVGRPPFLSDREMLDNEGFVLNAPFWLFFNEDTDCLHMSIVTGSFEWPDDSEVSEGARDLVARMLRVKMEDRITAEQALHHPWMCQEGHP
eukprot:m51a1_g13355 putative camk camk1 protein variant 1 (371) ;mRNA; r:523-2059